MSQFHDVSSCDVCFDAPTAAHFCELIISVSANLPAAATVDDDESWVLVDEVGIYALKRDLK